MIDKIEAGLFQSLEEIAELTFRINAIDEVITRLKAEEDIVSWWIWTGLKLGGSVCLVQ